MAKLRAVLFGKPTVYWNDKKVVFPFAKMEAMLYYLLVVGETTRESLAELLWGDMDEQAAKRNLRNTVYSLRKTLSAELLITSSRSTIALNRLMVEETDLSLLTIDDIGRFLERNSGEFLEGFYCKNANAFDDWVTDKKEQLRKSMISCLTKFIIQLMDKNEYKAAKQFLKRLTVLDTYNESAYRILMKIYAKEDDLYKVIETYREVERKARDLGLKPSTKTQEIYKRLKERKSINSNALRGLNNKQFYGREQELRRLQVMVDDFYLKCHSKRLILLQGEQGVGKSAIIDKFFETFSLPEIHVFRTQCYQAELDYAYKPWSHIFLKAMDVLTQAHVQLPLLWQQVIASVFPTVKVSDVLLNQKMTMDACNFGSTMVEEILCEILGRAAGIKRMIIVIEDIHWMDKQGLLLLRQLLRVYGNNIIGMATCEDSWPFGHMMSDFEREGMLEALRIERFSLEDVIKLSALRLTQDSISTELQHKLYDYTGGNALFLVECLNLIASGQDLSHGSLRLNSVLRERIGNVSDNGKIILEAASVFFNHANYEELLAVSGVNEFELVEAIEELQQKQLLMEAIDSGKRGLVYQFYNLQIRNYVYGQMSAIRQRMLHKRTAVYLEMQLQNTQSKDVYENIVYHYTNADEKLKVLEYTVKLAEKFCCPQYELFPELNSYYPSGHGDFREIRTQSTLYLNKIEKLLTLLPADAVDNEQLDFYKTAYLEMAGRYHIWRGEHFTGIKLIHSMLRLAAKRNLREYRVKGYQQIIYCGIQTRRAHVIRIFAAKLLHLAEKENLQEKKATALRFSGIAYALERQYQQAEDYYRQSLSLFKKLAARNTIYIFAIAANYNYIGDLRRASLDYPAALYHYEQAVRIAGNKNISEGVSLFYINAGYAAFEIHDYAKANHYLTAALALAEGFGDQRGYWCMRGYCTLHCVLALIAVRLHRPREGRSYLEKANEFLKNYNDHYQSGLVFRTATEIKLLMEKDLTAAEVFADYLPLPVAEYYRRAWNIFNKLDRIVELKSLEDMMPAVRPS